MTRPLALAGFLIRDLHTTLLAVLPPALAVALFWLTFYYPVSPDYLGSVGGWDMSVVCLLVTLLLADRANRAGLYPLVARLPGRWQLLAAVALAALAESSVIALGFAGLAVATGRVAIGGTQAVAIAVRWALALLLVVGIGLHLTRLVSRWGSHVLAAILLAAAITAGSWRGLGGGTTEALAAGLGTMAAPVAGLLGGSAGGVDWAAAAAVLGLAALLYALAIALLHRKDLLWPE